MENKLIENLIDDKKNNDNDNDDDKYIYRQKFVVIGAMGVTIETEKILKEKAFSTSDNSNHCFFE